MKNIKSFQDWLFESVKGKEANLTQMQNHTNQKSSNSKIKNEEYNSINRKNIISDVDAILNSLKVLTKELNEELNEDLTSFNDYFLQEAADSKGKLIWQWLFVIPKAKKAVAKLNKIKLNKIDLQFAADNAPNKEQKLNLSNKVSAVGDQISAIQKAINDKYGSYSDAVQRAMRSEKLKGEMEVIKRMSGMEDNPDVKKTLSQKMAEVQKSYKEQITALSELEPSEKEKEKAAKEEKERQERLKKEREELRKETEKEKDETEEDDETEPVNTQTGNGNTQTVNREMTPAEIEDFKTRAKERIKRENPDISDEDLETQVNTELEQEKERRNQRISDSFSAAAINKQHLLERAYLIKNKKLIEEIKNKEDFYFNEGSKVKDNLEYRLKIAEFNTIFESSKYMTTDIKSRFKKLL